MVFSFFFYFIFSFFSSITTNQLGNEYWKYSFENQNKESQKIESNPLFENLKVVNEDEYQKAKILLQLFRFDVSKVDKIFGIENKEWKRSFEVRGQQIYSQHKDTPNLFKKENWIEQSESELRRSIIQKLGDYISKFREFGWNYGNNVNFVETSKNIFTI